MSWLVRSGLKSYSYVIGLSSNADIIVNLQNPNPNPDSCGPTRRVLESDSYLYFSGDFEDLWEASIARIPLTAVYT